MIKEKRIIEFQKLGIGFFVHFGAYNFYEKGEWSLHLCNLDKKEYEKTALSIDCSNLSFDRIIESAKAIGAKYLVFTARHHDGFSLYDTKGLSDYDIMHSPNGKDMVALFIKTCRKNDIIPFIYHTTLDWRHPEFNSNFNSYLDYLKSSVEILCKNYGKIGGLWFDGNWSKLDEDWKNDELYSMIRYYQKDAIIVNNIGLVSESYLYHPEIDVITYEQGKATPLDYDKLGKYVAGEVCMPLNEHWGYAKNDINYKSVKDILKAALNCRHYNANLLLGMTPKKDLSVPTIQKGMFKEVGKWIHSHEKAFYDVTPTTITANNNEDFVLKDDEENYYFFFSNISSWGDENVSLKTEKHSTLFLNVKSSIKNAVWMEDGTKVEYKYNESNNSLLIQPKNYNYGTSMIARVAVINFN